MTVQPADGISCPGCNARYDYDIDTLNDTRWGLYIVVHGDQPTFRQRCQCSRSWIVTSNGAISRPRQLDQLEGAA